MKNIFVIKITYTKSLEVIDTILPAHREFLASGYQNGELLASGPMTPRIGGILIGIFENLSKAKIFFERDPYALEGAATYEFLEFTPVKHAEVLREYLGQ
ncbi:MAG: YciI family protein [Wolinella sp.]